MAAVTDFPRAVVVTLAQAIVYLRSFDIADALLQVKFFSKFTTRAHMLLNGNTLSNLSVYTIFLSFPLVLNTRTKTREVYENQTDYATKGSLLWILDKTVTRFGARLLKSWVGRPLIDRAYAQQSGCA